MNDGEKLRRTWYKSWEKAAQKLVKKLGKSWAEAAQLFPSFHTSFCAAFSQLLYNLLPGFYHSLCPGFITAFAQLFPSFYSSSCAAFSKLLTSLFFTGKSFAEAYIIAGEELRRSWCESWV